MKKKNLLQQNYLFHRNLQFQKFIKNSPSVLVSRMRDEDQTHMHPSQPLSPTTTRGWGNCRYTLVNFNLHQPLITIIIIISFLYMIPSCKQY